ncbi:preprotein translocase subunit SecG [Corynebacterium sp. Q4381]|uniref:preprotein translocase subunit SecG n=1 Tax=Corynebacterium sp. Marseille-Q4381 TaxID=3121597 RepID=UPI002FE64DD3
MALALQIVLVISSILMTIFVLLHKGKGGGLSSLFGGGVQANLSGSTTVERNLDRVTVVLAIIWIACIIALNLIQTYAAPVTP